MLIDTHSHLYLEEFKDDIDAVINRSLENEVQKIILPNINSESTNSIFELACKYSNILYPTLGLHPTSVKEDYKKELDKIFSNDLSNIVAVGEIGIDLYWDKTFIKEQQEALEYQINIALANNIPIIIHSRNSMSEIMDIVSLYKSKNLTGVFHCYSGNYQEAVKIIDMGFYLGIGGVLTYKKSHLPEIVTKIPLQNIVLETDAPYLSPVPYRGKRNEPAYIKIIAERLSELVNIEFEEVKKQTRINVNKLFKKIIEQVESI
jgi:TatD DNase family protein